MAKKKRKPPGKPWRGRSRPPSKPGRPPAPRETSLPRQMTWQQAEGEKETSAPLQRLPTGLEFKPGFPEPITYDPGRQLLIYRGFMYRGSYQYLQSLNSDLAYLTALEQIYVQSASSPPLRRVSWLLAALLAIGLMGLGIWWWLK
jgi:hypothetical protein